MLQELAVGAAAVIATGGGTPCASGHMELMRRAGSVVWIDVPMPALMPRIVRAGGDRPLLFGLKGAALEQRVAQLLSARTPRYALAHHRIDGDGAPTEVASRIAAALGDQAR